MTRIDTLGSCIAETSVIDAIIAKDCSRVIVGLFLGECGLKWPVGALETSTGFLYFHYLVAVLVLPFDVIHSLIRFGHDIINRGGRVGLTYNDTNTK